MPLRSRILLPPKSEPQPRDAMNTRSTLLLLLGSLPCAAAPALAQDGVQRGWLSWRGPEQAGTSPETGLVDTWDVDSETTLWTYELSGRGTPVVGDGRVYFLGYEGEGKDLQEMLVCLNESDGSKLWEIRWSDFLTDGSYDRYSPDPYDNLEFNGRRVTDLLIRGGTIAIPGIPPLASHSSERKRSMACLTWAMATSVLRTRTRFRV